MLEGAIAPLGSHYVLTLTATDCATGEIAGAHAGRSDQQASACSPSSARCRRRMRTRLGESLPSIAALRRADRAGDDAVADRRSRRTRSGLEERRRGRELESVAFFNQAIELDPEFASAYTTLSTVYGSLGEWRPQRGVRAAGVRASRDASASASGCSSPTSSTTASPATRTRRRDAGAVEGGLPARLAAAERAGADLQPHRPLRPRGRRGAGSAAAQPRASVSALEPGVRLPRARPLRRGARDGAAGGEARHRDDADAPAALSDWAGARRRLGGRAPDLGEGQAARVRSRLRPGAGGIVRGPAAGGARSLSAGDRHGGGARAERDGVRIRRASRVDRGALPRSARRRRRTSAPRSAASKRKRRRRGRCRGSAPASLSGWPA